MNADAANQFLGAVFGWTWRTSFHASVLIALVWLIQRTGGKWLSPRSRYALGILVLVRLLLPAVPASPWSIFNLRKAVLPRSTSPEIQVVSPSVTSATTAPAAFGSQIGPSEKAVAAGRKVDWANVGPVVWVLGLALSLAAVLAEHRKFARRINADPRIGDELILSLLAI